MQYLNNCTWTVHGILSMDNLEGKYNVFRFDLLAPNNLPATYIYFEIPSGLVTFINVSMVGTSN